MSQPDRPIEVRFEDVKMDVALVEDSGRRVLYVLPGQSLQSAVHQAADVLHMDRSSVERVLREAMHAKGNPHLLREINDFMGCDQAPPRVEAAPAPDSSRPRGRALVWQRALPLWLVAAAVAPALAAGWAIGHVSSPDAPQSGPTTATTRSSGDPYSDPVFREFSQDGQMRCEPLGPLAAKCQDVDGMVMLSEAVVGPDSSVFTFSYGSERIGLRLFRTPRTAKEWASKPSTQATYPRLRLYGRYALWGSDAGRLAKYGRLLANDVAAPEPPLRGEGASVTTDSSAPLPRRLAALALGTLGVTPLGIMSSTQKVVPGPVLVAVDLVLGRGAGEPLPDLGGQDVIAAAADVQEQPVPPLRPTLPPAPGDRRTPPPQPTYGPPPSREPEPSESPESTRPSKQPPAEAGGEDSPEPSPSRTEARPSEPTDPQEEPSSSPSSEPDWLLRADRLGARQSW